MSPDSSWTFDPGVVLAVAAVGYVYLSGWRRAREPGQPHPPSPARAAVFGSGLLSILVALQSPVDRLGAQLMSMHMIQHLLLLDLAPILLVLGLTKGILRPVTRRVNTLERRAGYLAHPAFAIALYVAVMWGWHVPAMYDAALNHPLVHVVEHICFAGAGSLYWWHLLSPIRARLRLGGMGPVLYMISTKLMVGLLGVGLTFAPTTIYPFYAHHPHYWGLTPGQDQNLAGLAMALEQSLVMGVALVILFVAMLNESERQEQRAERLEVASLDVT